MQKEHWYFLTGILVGGIIVFLASTYSQYTVPSEKSPVIVKEVHSTPYRAENNGNITGYQLPDEISFAGQEVPINDFSVKERLERELQVNAFWHSNSVMLIKRANRWLPTMDSILTAHGVPSDFKYLAVAESGLTNVISPANAVGYWQFLKATAKDYGLKVNKEVDQRYDPILSTVAAAKYLKKAYAKFGDWALVAVSYNMGVSATSRVMSQQQTSSYYEMFISQEPARYVFRIIALKLLLENSTQLGFNVPEESLYSLPPTTQTIVDESIADLHTFAADLGINYYQLRKLNPWIRGYKLTLSSGQQYIIKLPKD